MASSGTAQRQQHVGKVLVKADRGVMVHKPTVLHGGVPHDDARWSRALLVARVAWPALWDMTAMLDVGDCWVDAANKPTCALT
jgi:hypothetical protein